MARVKLFFRNGRTKIANFPGAGLKTIRVAAPRINPKIKKVKLVR